MTIQVVSLSPASHDDNRNALEEVRDFATTDMDRGGPERWTYRVLNEPTLTQELSRLSCPKSWRTGVDAVTFQPCQSYHSRSQDRYAVEEWPMPGGTWVFTGVFDGHMNGDTSELAARKFPSHLRQALEPRIRTAGPRPPNPESISEIIAQAIIQFDDLIISRFLNVLPESYRANLHNVNPSHIRQLINDKARGGQCYMRTAQAMGGTTALITLTDPRRENLWVANLGDCQAVLGSRDSSGRWSASLINSLHNGSNPQEVRRIRSEHPGEPDCVRCERVAGFLAPTRALGDAWLKLPATYTYQVFHNIEADWIARHDIRACVPRLLTPPYVSNQPDIFHRRLRPPSGHGGAVDGFLILCSDGLQDMYDGLSEQRMADEWVGVIGREIDANPRGSRGRVNLAMSLLRDALGGNDTRLVSRNLTVEMEERWVDDTTIVVQRLL
ncbi:protein serine/threonine phosphatase 2C [Obba rivulosa]|uniref:Protein serine/threonine phosphatase 2C n=1 Tax=Obba rivulosa TaxID=1052685 RepID=A0A8E2B303_9APHY|nr:protein serine/threonine phosphatase 2C [Obba rivulosa]